MADDFNLEQFRETAPPSQGFDLEQFRDGPPSEAEAAAHPPVAPQPLAAKMKHEGAVASTRDPQVAYLLEDPEARPRVEAGTSMAIPEGLLSVAAMGPIESIAKRGVVGTAKAFGSGLAKTYLGSKAGGYVGGDIGDAVHHPEAGRVAGSVVGGLYGGMGGKIPSIKSILSILTGAEEESAIPVGRTPGTVPGKNLSEPPAKVPAATAPAPGRPIPAPVSTEPRPEVVAGPATPVPTRKLLDRLGQQIEESAKYPSVEPTARAIPARSVGARAVLDAPEKIALPTDVVAGPRIDTASSNRTEVATMGEQVEQAAGGKPAGPLVSERNKGAFYENLTPQERQDIHTNLEVDRVPIPNAEKYWDMLKDKPDLRDDLFAMQNDQVREALRKSDIMDMSNKTVKSTDTVSVKGAPKSKDPNVIPRARAIAKMLDAGINPEEIVKWGGGTETRTKPAPERFKFGEQR